MKSWSYEEMLRALRIVALTDDARLQLFFQKPLGPEASWYLGVSDSIMPALRQRGWVRFVGFSNEAGALVTTRGRGDVRRVVLTEKGKLQVQKEEQL